MKTEKDFWDQAKELLEKYEVTYAANWKFDFLRDPKSLIFQLSKCKFAMRMATRGQNVLELGCEIGIGASVIGEMAKSYVGVDTDAEGIELARKNHWNPKYQFICDEYVGKKYGTFDSIVALDVMDRLKEGEIDLFLKGIVGQLAENGVVVLGVSAGEQVREKLKDYFW